MEEVEQCVADVGEEDICSCCGNPPRSRRSGVVDSWPKEVLLWKVSYRHFPSEDETESIVFASFFDRGFRIGPVVIDFVSRM